MSSAAEAGKKILIMFVMLGLSAAAMAAEPVGIPSVVPFADEADVPAAVREECRLGEKVASFVEKYAKGSVAVSQDTSGRYVDMAITTVHAPGGGGWSGPKWMEVTGTLQENGEAVASFRAKRFSTGGAFGGFKGTCAIIGRCTKALGKDIAKWIQKPVDGAELGDAK